MGASPKDVGYLGPFQSHKQEADGKWNSWDVNPCPDRMPCLEVGGLASSAIVPGPRCICFLSGQNLEKLKTKFCLMG